MMIVMVAKDDDDDDSDGIAAAATERYCQLDEPCFIQQARLSVPPLE